MFGDVNPELGMGGWPLRSRFFQACTLPVDMFVLFALSIRGVEDGASIAY